MTIEQHHTQEEPEQKAASPIELGKEGNEGRADQSRLREELDRELHLTSEQRKEDERATQRALSELGHVLNIDEQRQKNIFSDIKQEWSSRESTLQNQAEQQHEQPQERATKAFDLLPDPSVWKSNIETLDDARAVARAYRDAENITTKLSQEEETEQGDTLDIVRTASDVGEYFVASVELGKTPRLVEVDVSLLYQGGSSGSAKRKEYIDPVIEKQGLQETFEKLPPIVLVGNLRLETVEAEGVQKVGQEHFDGDLRIADGFTRTMIAGEKGLSHIRAYIIPPEAMSSTVQA